MNRLRPTTVSRFLLLLVSVALAFLLFSLPARAEEEAPGRTCGHGAVAAARGPAGAFARDRVLVKLSADAARRARTLPEDGLPTGIPGLAAFLARHGLERGHRVVRTRGVPVADPALFRRIGLDRWYAIELPGEDAGLVRRLVAELRREGWVEAAEPAYLAEPQLVPNDPHFPDEWHHENTGEAGGTPDADMDTPEAWDTETGDPSIVIAIIDTGTDVDHEDLVDNLVDGYDFGDDDPDPDDEDGHGTFTAGGAAARGNNGIGVAGVCWTCSIMPLKVMDSEGWITTDTVAAAIRWAVDNGARVLSMSLAFDWWSDDLADAVRYAEGRGAVQVAAIGNCGSRKGVLPSVLDEVIAVGGTDWFDRRIYSWGDHLEVSAPADQVWSTEMGDEYAAGGGTSAATPLVSGAAGLLLSRDPDLHHHEVRHLLRLGADDQVGAPEEDTPGWDLYMGYGRVNVAGSMALVDGPWIDLDRPHYLCAGDLTVAVKDRDDTGAVTVTVTTTGGDEETVTAEALTAKGYHEGTIRLAWAGKDGPVTPGDGVLQVADGDDVTASYGGMESTSFVSCLRKACRQERARVLLTGDCDGDWTADPGELIGIELPVVMFDTSERLPVDPIEIETDDPNVDLLQPAGGYTRLAGWRSFPYLVLPRTDGTDDPPLVRVHEGAPRNATVRFRMLPPHGPGWESDESWCIANGHDPEFTIPINRDLGDEIVRWDFDDGTAQGFTHEMSHGTGEVSECPGGWPPWVDPWEGPVSDRSHSGAYAMRVGDGTTYPAASDGALESPAFDVPTGGVAVTFRLWADTESFFFYDYESWGRDGLTVEARPAASSGKWSPLRDGSYNGDQVDGGCGFFPVPFGTEEGIEMFDGDGDGTGAVLDTFDVEQFVFLDPFAGQRVRVRFRFGSNTREDTEGQGLWLDTIAVREVVADTWPGSAPKNLEGSDARCPEGYELTWDPVPGSDGYNVYRSGVSCEEALRSREVYGTSETTSFLDEDAGSTSDFYYAVEGREPGTGCPTERSCVSGHCPCTVPGDPTGLLIDKSGDDVRLSWDDPGDPGLRWNVYRDASPDPSGWGAPHAADVTDEDPGTGGIQWTDAGAASDGETWFYLVTAVDDCGESPLR